MELKAMPVTLTSCDKGRVKEIYMQAFAKEDRMPYWLMLIMAKMKNTDFLSFYDGDTLCGFVYMATSENLTFVMFFAVEETLRSKGYGGNILEKVLERYPKNKIVITIERCDENANNFQQRLKRKEFYLRNGYFETGYLVELGDQKQEIIIKNGAFDPKEFIRFFKKYSNGMIKPKVWSTDGFWGNA